MRWFGVISMIALIVVVILAIIPVAALPDARYRLLTCASIQNMATLQLDGDGNGVGGDDFVRNFLVDSTPPTTPVAAASATGNVITATWPSSTDALSAVDGYGWQFDQNPTWTCDQTKDGGAATLTATSAALAPGAWYFHVCAVDTLGNWSPASSQGPFVIAAPAAIPAMSPLLLVLLAAMIAFVAFRTVK